MKPDFLKASLVIIGAIIFQLIFWQEKLGTNTILFDVFIILSIFHLYPLGVKNNTTRWILAGHLLSAAMVIFNNTILANTAYSISLLLFICFSQYVHRSIMYASGSLFFNYLFSIPNLFRMVMQQKGNKLLSNHIGKTIRILLIPGFLIFVFFIIYAISNTVFADISIDIIERAVNAIAKLFDWSFLPRFAFFLFGIIITTGLIVKTKSTYFSNTDLKQKDILGREKNHLKKWRANVFSDLFSFFLGKVSKGILALKNELKIGLISLIFLNVLLLVINIIDIKYVWFGDPETGSRLSSSVHQGAGSLIFSIVLAMLILLIFFRGNLNFYKQGKLLKYAAYAWIFQNMVVVISVFLRDYYYISHFGLAYKRLGLLFYLLMVIIGLVTVFLKIWKKKTSYYLLRINSWAAIIILIAASTVDWDYVMAKYNLERRSKVQVDIPFLLSLSNNTLPLIEKHKQILENDRHRWCLNNDSDYNVYNAATFFEKRKADFFEKQKHYSWLSWNVSDSYIIKQLHEPYKISIIK